MQHILTITEHNNNYNVLATLHTVITLFPAMLENLSIILFFYPGRTTYYSFIGTYYSSNSYWQNDFRSRDQWRRHDLQNKSEVHDFLLLSLVESDGKLESSHFTFRQA